MVLEVPVHNCLPPSFRARGKAAHHSENMTEHNMSPHCHRSQGKEEKRGWGFYYVLWGNTPKLCEELPTRSYLLKIFDHVPTVSSLVSSSATFRRHSRHKPQYPPRHLSPLRHLVPYTVLLNDLSSFSHFYYVLNFYCHPILKPLPTINFSSIEYGTEINLTPQFILTLWDDRFSLSFFFQFFLKTSPLLSPICDDKISSYICLSGLR